MYLSCQQSQLVDRIAIEKFGLTGRVLMENAGRSCAEVICRRSPTIAYILCGGGNNGGDGFVIARHLSISGVQTRTFMLAAIDRMSPDARDNYLVATKMGLEVVSMQAIDELNKISTDKSAVIVDAILGTGARGELRGDFRSAVIWANQHPGFRVAVDIPTGMNADTGDFGQIVFNSHQTLTFLAPKLGFRNLDGKPPLGDVSVVNIGLSLAHVQKFISEMPKQA